MQPANCNVSLGLMRPCPMSHPVLAGHVLNHGLGRGRHCPSFRSSSLSFLFLWPASSVEPVEASGFMSSWLCESFVFLIPAFCCTAEDWHVVSHPVCPSTSTKEEPVFQQLLQTDSPANLRTSLKALQSEVLASVCFRSTSSKLAASTAASFWWIGHRRQF